MPTEKVFVNIYALGAHRSNKLSGPRGANSLILMVNRARQTQLLRHRFGIPNFCQVARL